MKRIVILAALAFSPLCAAQKWVDEKGRVYYGEPPRGVKVKPAEMKGGGTGTVAAEDVHRQARARSKAAESAGAGTVVEYVPDREGGRPGSEQR